MLLIMIPLNETKSSLLTDTYVVKIRLDYLLHILIFLPFLLLAKLSYPVHLFRVILLGLVFAGVCEGLQYLLPYRSFNVNDLIANMIGTAIGIILVVGPIWGWLKGKMNSEKVNGEPSSMSLPQASECCELTSGPC